MKFVVEASIKPRVKDNAGPERRSGRKEVILRSVDDLDTKVRPDPNPKWYAKKN